MGSVPAPAPTPGERCEIDLLAGYGEYLRSLVDLDGLRPLKVVVDAGNGMAGLTTGAVLGPLGLDIVGLYLDLDGRFPNHMPNPLIPENLVAAQQAPSASTAPTSAWSSTGTPIAASSSTSAARSCSPRWSPR
jgi:phosphomannomutase